MVQMTVDTHPSVLVTGGTGFIGSWIVHYLLQDGYHVRVVEQPEMIHIIHKTFPRAGNQLEVFVIDDIVSGDYSDAFRGVNALIHVAFPTPVYGNSAKDIYEGGTKRFENVINTAIKAGIKKIIYTSSVTALYAPNDSLMFQPRSLTESDWGVMPPEFDPSTINDPLIAYPISKLICEKSFWGYAERNPFMDFTAILPSMVYGGWLPNYPVTNPHYSSNQIVHFLITGQPGEGPNSFPKWPYPQFVHVSDVAKAHIKALTLPPLEKGRKKRFIISQGSFTYLQAVQLLKRVKPELTNRLPPEDDPSAGVYSPAIYDTTFSEEVLGMKKSEYISAEKTWLETIDHLVAWEASKLSAQ